MAPRSRFGSRSGSMMWGLGSDIMKSCCIVNLIGRRVKKGVSGISSKCPVGLLKGRVRNVVEG